MKNARRVLGLILICGLLIFGDSVSALSESEYLKYSLNNILFYDPAGCVTGVTNKGNSGSNNNSSSNLNPSPSLDPDPSSTSNGDCKKINSSPDYNSTSYQTRLNNLHLFNQISGPYSGSMMCPLPTSRPNSTVKNGGCGLMSLSAIFYMFSGQGLNNNTVFEELRKATQKDGYNLCNQSSTVNFGSNTAELTQMSLRTISTSWNDIVNNLVQGKKVIIGVETGLFTSGKHIMMIDHYNAEKDKVYLFDPAMGPNRTNNLVNLGSSYAELYNGSAMNGVYVSKKLLEEKANLRAARALTYNGCYNGALSSGVVFGVDSADICLSMGGELVSGGMTLEQAEKWLEVNYINEAMKEKRGAYGVGYPNGTDIGNGWVNDAVGCSFGTLNNCSALSQWFVNNYTTAGPNVGSWDGGNFAGGLIETQGFENHGTKPIPYAIFSTVSGSIYGHTGIVLGVDEQNGKAYFGEAFCNVGGITPAYPKVVVYNLSQVTDTTYTYAYPANKLKSGGL